MLRQFPIAGFTILAVAAVAMVLLAVYLWVAFNALVGFIAILAAIGVIALAARLRRPPEVQ